MYNLSVGAIFKNESHSIREWIEHYIYRDVEHFYLIDDSSTDNTVEIIKPYISVAYFGLISLIAINHKH
jgi:glycosyltransferase involved in cell wall biosynthesis